MPFWTTGNMAVMISGLVPFDSGVRYSMSLLGRCAVATVTPSTAALFTVGLARIEKPLFGLDTICTANAS